LLNKYTPPFQKQENISMQSKILSVILAGGLAFAAGAALADQPLQLTEAQMDGVSAGATAIAVGGSMTFGDVLSETISASAATAIDNTFASAANQTAGVAASVFFGAASTSASASAASLP
jgi:hypothetical protein